MNYALVKKWFYYTDDNTEADGSLSPSIGIYESLEEANLAKRSNDILSLRAYLNYLHEDLIRGFSYWYDSIDYPRQILDLKRLLASSEFSRNIKIVGNEPEAYYFNSIDYLTDNNLLSLIDLLNLSFHEILSYKSVKTKFHAVINVHKWDHDIVFEMMQNGLVVMGGYGIGNSNVEWACVVKSRSGYEIKVYFDSYEEAELQTYVILKEFIDVYPDYIEILNEPIDKIAKNNIEILKAFIIDSSSFQLSKNQEEVYIELSSNKINYIELKSVLDLVDDTYYNISEIETEINGNKIKVIDEALTF